MKFLLVEEDKKEPDYLGERGDPQSMNNNNLNESLHSLGSNCFITDNPYDIKNLLLNKPKLYRILYDANIDMYMIGDGREIIHQDLLEKAFESGYYTELETNKNFHKSIRINAISKTSRLYAQEGIDGLYNDIDNRLEYGPYLLYMVFSPNEDDFVLGEDSYDDVLRFSFGSLFFRDADQGLMNKCDLIRLLQKQSRANESMDLNESVSLQDKHAVREFADECKVDGLPLMDYKEFSELLNGQGMKPNEELYQVYVDAYNNEEDTDYIEVIKKKFEKMSSNEIIDLLDIPNSSNIDSDSPMFILPNGSIISVAQAGKLIGQELSDNIHSDMVYVILSAIANEYNYDWDIDDGYYEERKLSFLTHGLNWARLNCGEIWAEPRFYCVLPNHMTSAQYSSLEKWLEWGYDNKKEKVIVYVSSDEVSQAYYFNETFPEDIIKKIKRYYSSGRLYEGELKENMDISKEQYNEFFFYIDEISKILKSLSGDIDEPEGEATEDRLHLTFYSNVDINVKYNYPKKVEKLLIDYFETKTRFNQWVEVYVTPADKFFYSTPDTELVSYVISVTARDNGYEPYKNNKTKSKVIESNELEKETMNEEFVNELIPGELYHFIHNNKILYGTFKRKTPVWLFFDVDGKEVLAKPWTNVATTTEELEEIIGLVNKIEKDTKIPPRVPNRFTRVPNQHNKPIGESNKLEQRAKKHKKKNKGLGWYPGANFNSDAGDVEKGIEVFNDSVGDFNTGEGMSMGESVNNTNTYYYDGPIYYRGNKIAAKSSIYTSAPTINIASRNILFRAADGAVDFYNYDIVDSKVKLIKSGEQPKIVSKREVCSHCGYDLNDMGECPVCDYGEYDLLDEGLSSLEALWTLHRNLDD